MEAEQILEQFEKYCDVLKKVIGTPSTEKLGDLFGERLAMSPRGLTEETGGNPGGLVDFGLKVALKPFGHSLLCLNEFWKR